MLDLLRVMIPFKAEYCFQLENRSSANQAYHFELDVRKVSSELGITTGVRTLQRNADMTISSVSGEYIPYDSIPTSFTGVAIKFNNGSPNIPPSVEIKASPAKILQGHNIFGPCSILLGYAEMCSALELSHPMLADMLEWDLAEVMQLDCTFSANVGTEQKAKQAIAHMANVSHGQVKASRSEYETTCYHNRASSHWRGKCYSKQHEFEKQYNDYRTKAEKGDKHAQSIVDAMSDPRLHRFVRWLIRFEASVTKRKLKELNIPTKINDLINYQQQLQETGKELIQELWLMTYGELINHTYRGHSMNIYDDELVQSTLRIKHQKVTPKGNVSYAKADRAFSFYRRLVNEGYLEVKRSFSVKQTFYNNLNTLIESGFTKAQLQNLQGNGMNKVVPLVDVITVDFSQQYPDWYLEPEFGPLTRQLLANDNVVQLRTA
ncbi:phage/plasmid replication protein, II/X family [Vibrio parahaemolyticus]|nr:phage/plasmid replication protein, II/X family [Vibrio parahaemolyticus]HCG6654757.1 hypothetical protein [Vibrio parahaemolyticus]